MPNSPAFGPCTPRLFSTTRPGGNSANGTGSSPAEVQNMILSWGASAGNSFLVLFVLVTRASAVGMAAA